MTDKSWNLWKNAGNAKETAENTKKWTGKYRKRCNKAKEKYINDQCTDLEDLQKKDPCLMYHKIRSMNKAKPQNANIALRDKSGNFIFEKDKTKTRCVKSIGDLFHDNRPEKPAKNLARRQPYCRT